MAAASVAELPTCETSLRGAMAYVHVVRRTFSVSLSGTQVHSHVSLGPASGGHSGGCFDGECHAVEVEEDLYTILVTTRSGDPSDLVYYRVLVGNIWWTTEKPMTCAAEAP